MRCSAGALWIQEIRHAASFRWHDLRGADSGNIRLAVAEIALAISRPELQLDVA